eukprot:5416036-Pleurochrysis_carterae.AAC.1
MIVTKSVHPCILLFAEIGSIHCGFWAYAYVSQDIVKVAGDAMKRNLTQLGPLVLPLSEQIKERALSISAF